MQYFPINFANIVPIKFIWNYFSLVMDFQAIIIKFETWPKPKIWDIENSKPELKKVKTWVSSRSNLDRVWGFFYPNKVSEFGLVWIKIFILFQINLAGYNCNEMCFSVCTDYVCSLFPCIDEFFDVILKSKNI